MQAIAERSIDEVIFTGNSGGAGIAQVAHLLVQAEAEKTGSDWHRLVNEKKLTFRSLCFGVNKSWSIVRNFNPDDKKSAAFFDRFRETSFNIPDPLQTRIEGFVCEVKKFWQDPWGGAALMLIRKLWPELGL